MNVISWSNMFIVVGKNDKWFFYTAVIETVVFAALAFF